MEIGDIDKELGELMRDVVLGDFRVQLFYRGTDNIGYRFFDCGEVIFEGTDYGSSRMECVDSDSSVLGLLGFLSMQYGDCDRDYFTNYTERQLEWMTDRAEDLKAELYALEDESGNFVGELRDSPTKNS